MRILLTNDDGLMAPGIRALWEALQGLGEILVVAPQEVQSATSHGITFHEPLLTQDVQVTERMRGIAVEGRPADCVKLALRAIWQEKYGAGTLPDVTISGMNAGANVGINVIYSGTVAAAVESAFLGVPAIAVSLYLGDREHIHFKRAAQMARAAIDRVLQHTIDKHSVININIPIVEHDDAPMPAIKVVEMNSGAGTDGYERRVSPWGRVYYWSNGDGMEFSHTSSGSDVEALNAGHITITPLSYELTDFSRMEKWRKNLST
ncbi:MAG TPA: 5'/3'-nucleotidase SurE [Phycisphaerales bacterium]|nr:5'/3'-nucleotidase SurE [Phycisphaerales bacterium]